VTTEVRDRVQVEKLVWGEEQQQKDRRALPDRVDVILASDTLYARRAT